MAQGFDPGLTQQYAGSLRRVINRDGTFNVHRQGGKYHLYFELITLSWPVFYAVAITSYLVTNFLFALIYVALGTEYLSGGDPTMSRLANAFFFSSQTLTTVGYGHIAPKGLLVSSVAAFEAMIGVMGFAVVTGLLYGRVSRPSARLAFSHNMVVAPYENGTSFQFRVGNARRNSLMDIEATVLLMTVVRDPKTGELRRKYDELHLERKHVSFLPLTWTVVHPVREHSPLYGKTAEDLRMLEAEILILMRFFDDTFSQTVNARYSYRYEEILWNKRFEPAFLLDEHGDMVLQLDRIHATRPA